MFKALFQQYLIVKLFMQSLALCIIILTNMI